MVARIAAGQLDELPRFGAQTFGGGMEIEKLFVEFEQCHDAIRCGDGQTDGPGDPIQIGGGGVPILDAQERGDGQTADGHGDSEDVKHDRIQAASVAVLFHQKAIPFFDAMAL